eukprot:TRINITY_DN57838_c0_g1_i1.p1 TRINITY_DN57838_c0_g1~~TRINITY_DN57838_c0_g1_i1.p1  ORF type:complete len:338 (+),score=205.26 TRINITY_DN57838_c0_g1_i1:76-1089(+)
MLDMHQLLQMSDPNQHKKFVKGLPPKVQSRTKALLGLEAEAKEVREQCDKELDVLRQKYHELFSPIYAARAEIVAGKTPATTEALSQGKAYMMKKAQEYDEEEIEDVEVTMDIDAEAVAKGIPGFWKKVLENHTRFKMRIEEWDEPVLEHLIDLRFDETEFGFSLIFQFSENEWFTNKQIIKSYTISKTDDDVEVEKIFGDDIAWKEGKNITETTTKKKKKSGKNVRLVSTVKPRDSFFTFFQTLDPEDEDYTDMQELDFELGLQVKEALIPRAVEHYCGEHVDDDDDDDDEEEEDFEDDDDLDDDDDDDEDEAPKKGKGKKNKDVQGQPQADCKQQ